jgi:hypothetical protein
VFPYAEIAKEPPALLPDRVTEEPRSEPDVEKAAERSEPDLPPDIVAEPAEAKVKKPYEAGEWVAESKFDPDRLPKGYKLENGRITRIRNSNRPESILPEVWNAMTGKQKAAELKRIAETAVPPPCTVNTMPCVDAADCVPTMPCRRADTGKKSWTHRERVGDPYGLRGLAMVARTVPPKEVKVNKKAQEAMDKEWASLREIGAWNEKGVREWTDVKKDAKRHETRVHVGMVFGICVEKGSELAPDDPKRKYKGRVVFRGNDVRDEENYLATFQDMGSAPASMASGKFLDFIGM